jgi:adenylate cyclase
MEVVNHFRHGLSLYRNGSWDRAIDAFEEALNLHKDEKICRMYIERCEYLKKSPPGDGWSGVWIMKSK